MQIRVTVYYRSGIGQSVLGELVRHLPDVRRRHVQVLRKLQVRAGGERGSVPCAHPERSQTGPSQEDRLRESSGDRGRNDHHPY